jgi:hypothetical protein
MDDQLQSAIDVAHASREVQLRQSREPKAVKHERASQEIRSQSAAAREHHRVLRGQRS